MGYQIANKTPGNVLRRSLGPRVNLDYDLVMLDMIHSTRHRNLVTLLERRGEAMRLAKLIKVEPNYLSRIKSGKKRIGEEIARRIEQALGLEYGWLDHQHETQVTQEKCAEEEGATLHSITATTLDDLIVQIGELETEQLLNVIMQALAVHAQKKGKPK